jgi:hypothetical protein
MSPQGRRGGSRRRDFRPPPCPGRGMALWTHEHAPLRTFVQKVALLLYPWVVSARAGRALRTECGTHRRERGTRGPERGTRGSERGTRRHTACPVRESRVGDRRVPHPGQPSPTPTATPDGNSTSIQKCDPCRLPEHRLPHLAADSCRCRRACTQGGLECMRSRPARHSSLSGIRGGHFSGFVPSWGTLTTATRHPCRSPTHGCSRRATKVRRRGGGGVRTGSTGRG